VQHGTPGNAVDSRAARVRQRLILAVSLAALLLLTGPSGPNDIESYCNASGDCITEGDDSVFWGLKPGVWSGEAAALGHLEGTAQGVRATWDGGVASIVIIYVEEDQEEVDGDWSFLESGGLMTLTGGEVSGTIDFTSITGDGTFSGTPFDLMMTGATVSSGTIMVNTSAGPMATPFTGPSTPFNVPIELTSADCRELVGEWIPPLEGMAEDAGWSTTDIDGFFYAYFLGDDPSEELLEEIDQLVTDADAWGSALVDIGAFDGGAADDLVDRAIEILNNPDLLRCVYNNPLTGDDPAEFMLNFLATMVADVDAALASQTFRGFDLYEMGVLLHRLGAASPDSRIAAAGEAAFDGIQQQAQRIISENMSGEGDGCAPCLTGERVEALGAALAGQAPGHSYDIDGTTYTAEEVLTSLELPGVIVEGPGVTVP
jgi:hypothetical protein